MPQEDFNINKGERNLHLKKFNGFCYYYIMGACNVICYFILSLFFETLQKTQYIPLRLFFQLVTLTQINRFLGGWIPLISFISTDFALFHSFDLTGPYFPLRIQELRVLCFYRNTTCQYLRLYNNYKEKHSLGFSFLWFSLEQETYCNYGIVCGGIVLRLAQNSCDQYSQGKWLVKWRPYFELDKKKSQGK